MQKSPTSTTNANNGFTLIEMVVALAIASMVMIGVYTIFDTTVSVRSTIMAREDMATITARLSGLLNADVRQTTGGDITLSRNAEGDELGLVTRNSITLNGAAPVSVSWYLEEEYLVRREVNEDMDLDVAMKILPKVTEFTVEFFTGSRYEDRAVPDARLLRATLVINEREYRLIIGQTVTLDAS